jgi:hypothetical protein
MALAGLCILDGMITVSASNAHVHSMRRIKLRITRYASA